VRETEDGEKGALGSSWSERLPFFYGWIVVAVSFVCFAVGYATWNSFSIFYVAILDDFGWSRAATAGVFSVFTIVYGLNAPIAGSLTDRYGPRRLLPIGALILGLGLLLTTRLSTLWEFYLLYGVVAAVGLSAIGTVPTFSVLSNWFIKKRGTAGGIATAGIGVGMLLFVPLLQGVINNHGWRAAYLLLSIVIVAVIPVTVLLFHRHRPQEMGLMPDGERRKDTASPASTSQLSPDNLVVDREWTSREWTLRSAMHTHRFWLVSMARFLEMACLQTIMTHQAAFFVDEGFDNLLAASIVGIVGIMGSCGKILWGTVSDRIGRESTYLIAFICGTVGVGALLTIQAGSPGWMLYAYGAIYGLCYGVSAVLCPVMMGDIFQGKSFGAILGGAYVLGNAGSAIGAFLGGYVFDVTGAYHWAFMLTIPGMWLSCLLYWLAAPRKVRRVAGRADSTACLQPQP